MYKKFFVIVLLLLMFVSFNVAFASKEEISTELDRLDSLLETFIERLRGAGATETTYQPPEGEPIPASMGPGLAKDSNVPDWFRFTQNLKRGAVGDSARFLQIVLNMDPATQVASSGFGSPGNESRFFGWKTLDAVKRFQQKYASEVLHPIGLTSPTGFVGTYTRRKLNAILDGHYVITPGHRTPQPTQPTEPTRPPVVPLEEDLDEIEREVDEIEKEMDDDKDEKKEEDAINGDDGDDKDEGDEQQVVENPCRGQSTFRDSRDQKTYSVVEIGSQCWMSENLNHSITGSWCYGNEESNCDDYGRLYDFNTARNICPTGWKLPSDGDYRQLEVWLGMSSEEAQKEGWRGTNEGEKIKSDVEWDGTNDSRFSALPGGAREANGTYHGMGIGGLFWTSTGIDASAWARHLYSGYRRINRLTYPRENALYVRCIRD